MTGNTDIAGRRLPPDGMVGFLTRVTRTPFTSTVLVLEMTGSHNLIVPQLMLDGMVANIVSMVHDKHSFYDHLKLYSLRETLEKGEWCCLFQPWTPDHSNLSGFTSGALKPSS